MKDFDGNNLYIDSEVTLLDAVRPKHYIGRHATIEKFGEKNIVVRVESDGLLQGRILNVPPETVRLGRHEVSHPVYDNPDYQRVMYVSFEGIYHAQLSAAVAEGIISSEQKEKMKTLYGLNIN